MSCLVAPRLPGTRNRMLATTVLAAMAAIAIVSMWTTARPAFADVHRIELQSKSVVGALPGDVLSPAVRLDPPKAADAAPMIKAPADSLAPVTTLVNRSTCRSDIAGPVMTIVIPDISYSCPVYAGGQTMLDSGAVTRITDDAINQVLADHPGGPGVLWIGAHRASHSGAFAQVPSLRDGALVTMSDGTFTATYRIVGRAYVSISNDRVVDASGQATGAATLNTIIRADHGGAGASRLLLQTCDGENHRWMIYADLVTG